MLRTRDIGHGAGDTLVDIENVLGSKYSDIISGDDEGNVLNGFSVIDRLFGGDRDDTLSGSSGVDRYVFDVANFGNDTITDFANGSERMDMRGSNLSYSDLTITQSGGDTVISVNGATDTITLENVTTVIDASDFIF